MNNDEAKEMIKEALLNRKEYADFEKSVEDHPELWVPYPEWLSAKYAREVKNSEAVWSGDEDVVA